MNANRRHRTMDTLAKCEYCQFMMEEVIEEYGLVRTYPNGEMDWGYLATNMKGELELLEGSEAMWTHYDYNRVNLVATYLADRGYILFLLSSGKYQVFTAAEIQAAEAQVRHNTDQANLQTAWASMAAA